MCITFLGEIEKPKYLLISLFFQEYSKKIEDLEEMSTELQEKVTR